jgi:uncharacterized protein (TIGR03382 family)
MSKRATLALGLLFAAGTWISQASALSYTATFNIPDTGGDFGDVVNHFDGPNVTNTDNITVNLTGPNAVNPNGSGGAVALNISFGAFQIAGFSSFSYVWKSDNLLTNISGTLSTSAQNTIALPFGATTPAGDPYSSYHLLITTTTNGSAGGGYVYSLSVDPCTNCATTTLPVPPAAILFVSALGGLGLLGRRRRKSAQDLTA